MKSLLLTLFFCFSAFVAFSQQSKSQKTAPITITNEIFQDYIIIKVRSNNISTEQLNFLNKIGLESPEPFIPPKPNTNLTRERAKMNVLGLNHIYKLKLTKSLSAQSAVKKLSKLEWIEYAEPIYNHQLLVDPDTLNEPFVGFHWGHENANIYSVWDSTFGDTSIVVGIIDAGCLVTHLSLKDALYYNDAERFGTAGVDDDNNGFVDDSLGYDFANNDPDVIVNHHHGTQVTGVVTAKLNDGIGSYGVAPGVRIMPINIATTSGALIRGYEALVYAAENGCDVINLSWGRVGSPTQLEQDIINMVTEAYDVVIVAAAGNTPAKLDFYPASYQNVISVAHITQDNIGFATYSDFIDLSAPGVNIPSTTTGGGIDGNGHLLVTGSSFASPFVAAAAALLKSAKPSLNARQIEERLRQTANPDIYDVPDNEGKAFGLGRLDLLNALNLPDSIAGVRLLNHNFQNQFSEGLIIPGDTVSLTCDFINYLNPTKENFEVSISCESDDITLIDSIFDIGVLGELDTISNDNTPFKFVVSPNISPEISYTVIVTYHYENRENKEAILITVPETSLDITFNTISTTIDANGRIGYTGNTIQNNGIGFEQGLTQLLNQSDQKAGIGLLISDGNNISDCIFDDQGAKTNDFGPKAVADSTIYDSLTMAESYFGDFRATNPIGLDIKQTTFGWKDEDRENYLLVTYSIENTTDKEMDSLQVGIFADWQLNDGLNKALWDSEGQFGYVTDTGKVVAIKTVSSIQRFQPVNTNGISAGVDLSDGLTKDEKLTLLNTDNKEDIIEESDVSILSSTTIYGLEANSSRDVAFLLLAANSLEDIRTAIDSLPNTLVELYSPTRPQVTDTLFCSADSLEIRPDSVGDYRFYTDSTLTNLVHSGRFMPVNLEDTGKVFYVTDATLPLESDAIAVGVHWAKPIANFSIPDSIDLDTNPLLTMNNQTSNWPVSKYKWHFGDGNQSTEISPTHSYNLMGNYTIDLKVTGEVSNCMDTINKTIVAYRSSYKPQVEDIFACHDTTIVITPTGGSNFEFYQQEDKSNLLGSGSSLTLTNIQSDQTIYVLTTDSVFDSPLVPIQIEYSAIEAIFEISSNQVNTFIADTLFVSATTGNEWFWDFGNGKTATDQNSFVIYESADEYTITLTIHDTLGCSASSSQTITAISEEPNWTDDELKEALQIFPNPNKGNFNILFSSNNYQEFNVVLISSIGQEVLKENFTRNDGTLIPVDIQFLQNGLYLLQINMHGASVIQRIVVDKD